MSKRKRRISQKKKSNALYSIIGFVLMGFGLKAVVTKELSYSDTYASDVQWVLSGAPAVITGFTLFILGGYWVYVSFTTKS